MTVFDELRGGAATWGMAAIFPLLILVAIDPAKTGDIACAYLGLATCWLAVEIHRFGNPPGSANAWKRKFLAVAIAVGVNVAIFITFGITANVQTYFPFPLMAGLSALPAIGMIPWLMRRVRQPHLAMVLTAVILLTAKLAGCVAARFAYGPDYVAQGYVAADWRTAKLMLSIFWTISTSLSALLLFLDYRRCLSRVGSEKPASFKHNATSLNA